MGFTRRLRGYYAVFYLTFQPIWHYHSGDVKPATTAFMAHLRGPDATWGDLLTHSGTTLFPSSRSFYARIYAFFPSCCLRLQPFLDNWFVGFSTFRHTGCLTPQTALFAMPPPRIYLHALQRLW